MFRAFDSKIWESPYGLDLILQPICDYIGLPYFALVAHISFYSFVTSIILQYLSSTLCPILFPKTYPKLKSKADDWDLHIVGWIYSLIATPLALSLILSPSPEILINKLYGFALPEARLSAFAVGYFLWDAKVSAQHIKTQGLGFFLHGAGCAIAFLFTMRPFLLYCAPDFLIWEVSTIFLNLHWYLDKFGMTGSTAQLINGIFLLSAYVGARLIWGTYNSYKCISLLFGPKADPNVGFVKYIYGGINIMLNTLNFFWFRSMILALRKRFVKSDPGARYEAQEVSGKLSWSKKDKKK